MTISDTIYKVMCWTCCLHFYLVVEVAYGIKVEINGVKSNMTTVRNILPQKWIHRKSDNVLFPVLENMDITTSRHVAFTEQKPLLPPSADFKNSVTLNSNDVMVGKVLQKSSRRTGKSKRKNHKMRNRRKHRRRHFRSRLRSKRSHIAGEASSVCTSISKWVAPSGQETLDQYGQTVKILPYIKIGTQPIPQYIYETSCLEDNIPCTGIDKRHYKSECVTKKVYAYAYVRSSTGEENWSYIEIDGYCNCKLQRKHHSGPRNILDYLSLDLK